MARSGRENTAHAWPWIEHERWNFQDDNQLPPPGQLIGGEKKYRAGIGNSVRWILTYCKERALDKLQEHPRRQRPKQ